jgi:hypothetical protein
MDDSLAYRIVFLTAKNELPEDLAMAFFGIAAEVRRMELERDAPACPVPVSFEQNVVRVEFGR